MTFHPSQYEYFLGIALPEPENTFFAELKRSFQDQRPLSSPPHLTLLPPFEFPNWQRLDGLLQRWASHQEPFEAVLERVGSFKQKKHGTVFLEPRKGEPFKQLINSLNDFFIELEPVGNFHPHLTVGHKVPHEDMDTRKSQLRAMELSLKWKIQSVTLYRHQPGEKWSVLKSYALGAAEAIAAES